MPFADPEKKKQYDADRRNKPGFLENNRENYRRRYSENINGLADKVKEASKSRWSNDPIYRERTKRRSEERWAENWAKEKFIQLRSKARRCGLEFAIEIEDLVLPTHCPIFGMPLVRAGGSQTNASPSVDRIDNSKGYVKGNVVVVSLKANSIKRDTTLAELKKMVEFYETLERLKRD